MTEKERDKAEFVVEEYVTPLFRAIDNNHDKRINQLLCRKFNCPSEQKTFDGKSSVADHSNRLPMIAKHSFVIAAMGIALIVGFGIGIGGGLFLSKLGETQTELEKTPKNGNISSNLCECNKECNAARKTLNSCNDKKNQLNKVFLKVCYTREQGSKGRPDRSERPVRSRVHFFGLNLKSHSSEVELKVKIRVSPGDIHIQFLSGLIFAVLNTNPTVTIHHSSFIIHHSPLTISLPENEVAIANWVKFLWLD